MNRVGLSSCTKKIDPTLFAAYRAAGIDAMEICPDHGMHGGLDYEQIGAWAKEYGITLWSLHLPFSYEHDPSLPAFMTDSYPYYCDLIARAAKIGVRYCVIHPSREPIEEGERAQRMENAKKSLALLCEYASAVGVVLAVEDLPRTCLGRNSAEILELISAHPNLRVCFDTNHLLGENPVDFVRAVGEKTVTLHVSDYDGIDERHWLPGEGCIDWQALRAALTEVGYDGVWMYELSFGIPKSLPRGRDLCCADFVKNAAELAENAPLTRVK